MRGQGHGDTIFATYLMIVRNDGGQVLAYTFLQLGRVWIDTQQKSRQMEKLPSLDVGKNSPKLVALGQSPLRGHRQGVLAHDCGRILGSSSRYGRIFREHDKLSIALMVTFTVLIVLGLAAFKNGWLISDGWVGTSLEAVASCTRPPS